MLRPGLLLIIAGDDPSGAGIKADSGPAAALGSRTATLITCLTIQNPHGVKKKPPTAPDFLESQAACLLEDRCLVAAHQPGLSPDLGVLEAILNLLTMLFAGTPLILEPVLGASAGGPLSKPRMASALRARPLPRVLLSTPNLREARRLWEIDATPRRSGTAALGGSAHHGRRWARHAQDAPAPSRRRTLCYLSLAAPTRGVPRVGPCAVHRPRAGRGQRRRPVSPNPTGRVINS